MQGRILWVAFSGGAAHCYSMDPLRGWPTAAALCVVSIEPGQALPLRAKACVSASGCLARFAGFGGPPQGSVHPGAWRATPPHLRREFLLRYTPQPIQEGWRLGRQGDYP